MISPVGRTRSLLIVVAVAIYAGVSTQVGMAQKPDHADHMDHAERKIITKVEPVYPDLAKRMHLGGVVKVEAVVLPNGNVKSTRVVGGNPVLIESATDAIRKYKFQTASSESTESLQLTFEPR
jgi:TonB family protein